MTYREQAVRVWELRNSGGTYQGIADELGLTKTQVHRMGGMDIRSEVHRHCDDCGKEWSALVFPWDTHTFRRCVECASVEWEAHCIVAERLRRKDVEKRVHHFNSQG